MANPAYLMLIYFLVLAPDLLTIFHTEDETADQKKFLNEQTITTQNEEPYEYIVIGGGSAGGVIANRLSRNHKVLLLERGGNPTPLSLTPYLWLYLARIDPRSSMRYQTTPQSGYSLQTNGVVTLLQGRVLGGTSNLNQMVYTRGNRRMFDEWVEITGDQDWSYQSTLNLYKRFEDYHGTYSEPFDWELYGRHNELHIEPPNLIQPSTEILFDAIKEKGLPIKDLNRDQSTGFQSIDFNSKNGQRWGTYQAFIEPWLLRINLVISRYSTATKIHLDENKKAYGVTYTRHGQTRFATATKEIVVSAGVFESPKLLMLSGIGPAQELSKLGIEPLVDLPVGKNLMDHHMVTFTMNLDKNVTFVPERDFTVLNDLEYKAGGSGLFRNTFGTLGYSSSTFNNDDSYPDLQYFIQHQTDPGTNPADVDKIRSDSNTIALFLVKSKSEPGEVTLASSDPNQPPLINPNYAAHPEDVQRLIQGIKFIVDLYENSETYKEIGAKLSEHNFPDSCKSLEYRSDEYWGCVIRHLGESGHHFVGTCSLGSVVDSKLRVKGVTQLRVADASIMPTLPNCNTNAPAMMIGERCSALLVAMQTTDESNNRVGNKFRNI